MERKLTHLSLFSGIGGLDLAAEWAGFTTVGQCEFADYPTKVLEKHWPEVPRWRDIRDLTGESFYDRTGLRTVDVISGGFPCQPFSVAGKRRGKSDDRYLWPCMLRVITEIRPAWVVGENVAGIVNMALDTVLSDLEGIGYSTQAFIIPACAVDAPHKRDRCAIVANTNSTKRERPVKHGYKTGFTGFTDSCRTVSDANDRSRDVRRDRKLQSTESVGESRKDYERRTPEHGGGEWWAAEPDVGRVAHGVPSRVDRLRCLGNAVVPQQFYPVFKAIADVENA